MASALTAQKAPFRPSALPPSWITEPGAAARYSAAPPRPSAVGRPSSAPPTSPPIPLSAARSSTPSSAIAPLRVAPSSSLTIVAPNSPAEAALEADADEGAQPVEEEEFFDPQEEFYDAQEVADEEVPAVGLDGVEETQVEEDELEVEDLPLEEDLNDWAQAAPPSQPSEIIDEVAGEIEGEEGIDVPLDDDADFTGIEPLQSGEQEPDEEELDVAPALESSVSVAAEAPWRKRTPAADDSRTQPDAKRPKVAASVDGGVGGGSAGDKAKKGATVEALLKRLGLQNDGAARYVANAHSLEDLEEVLRSKKGLPRNDGRGKTAAEHLNNALLKARDSKEPPGGTFDRLQAMAHVRQLSNAEFELLRELTHKDLQYVFRELDSQRPLEDLVIEAMDEPKVDAPTLVSEAVPNAPGVYAMGRQMRLELIDPTGDALVCGDANLTFSLLLAQHRHALGHVGRTVATTFETLEILRERYQEIDDTVKELKDLGCLVLHNVDGTRLLVDKRFNDMKGLFGAAYYNFPHAGVVQGFFDGHPFVRWRHENLMTLFFRALCQFMKPGGIVKVASNSSATGVRYSDIIIGARASEFVHAETIPFMEWALRKYRRSYGDRRDENRRPDDGDNYRSQNAQADMVYCFEYLPSGEVIPKPQIRLPPTKQDILQSSEGKLAGMRGHTKEQRVDEIYQLFLSYVNGIHIG